jgi:hypothetical protein
LKHRLQSGIFSLLRGDVHLEESIVGFPLDGNEIGDVDDLTDFAKIFSYPPACQGSFRHISPTPCRLQDSTCGQPVMVDEQTKARRFAR